MARHSEDGGEARLTDTRGGRMARCETLLLVRAAEQRRQQRQHQQQQEQQQQQQPNGSGGALGASGFYIARASTGTGLVSASHGGTASSDDANAGYLPDSVYTIMLRGYCDRRDAAGVSQWLTRLLADRRNDVSVLNGETVAAIIRCLCEVGCARLAVPLEPLLLTEARVVNDGRAIAVTNKERNI